ncbi:hypothetical protein ONZ45_g3857 [Pleurotus djamor]|nr:hypothetical protein ONZ45_g3857 [Pleurotus djamor]
MASPAFYPDHDHDPRNLSHPYPPIPISTQTKTNTIYTHNTSPIRPDSSSTLTVVQKSDDADSVTVRDVLSSRTPSPTPSEARELKTGAIDWKAILNWRFWIRREWAWYYVIIIILVTITALVSIFHKEIVQWLRPAATWLHKLPFGWLAPIGILFVISFPPLFGHEIVAILCGLVWGLWIGFGIVAAGTFLGEVGNFYAFKYCCRSRGEKLERTNTSYACLAKVVRDGGFRIALAARLSAIPGHFTTAVFSTCGMNIFVFSLAAILSLPKQFITVYLGVMLEQSESGQSTSTSKLISNIVLGITILITIGSMWYILHKMNKVKPDVIYAKRKARQAKLARAGLGPVSSDATLASEGGEGDEGMVPLKRKSKGGNGKKTLFAAPQPQRPSAYTNPYDSYAAYESSDSDPDSYNYAHPSPSPTQAYHPHQHQHQHQQPHNPYGQPQVYNQRSSLRGSRRSGSGRTRSGSGSGSGGLGEGLGGRGRGDVLSIVREDSEEVGGRRIVRFRLRGNRVLVLVVAVLVMEEEEEEEGHCLLIIRMFLRLCLPDVCISYPTPDNFRCDPNDDDDECQQ